jgi:uncharacterized Fe-S cluster-containing protein
MTTTDIELPGLDCGMCGYRTCEEFRTQLAASPESIRRCIHLSEDRVRPESPTAMPLVAAAPASGSTRLPLSTLPTACGSCAAIPTAPASARSRQEQLLWKDSLGRDIDFYLEHFPEEPGPREIILPHNPLITREMDVRVGDILIGRPLGMSCGCPITHCGVATQVDSRTGVIVWCVTGPLGPRQKGFKDLGYYIAEGYEGLVKDTRAELKVGWRYFFQPRMCMLQWRHSGLLNYLNRVGDHWQVRLEGLWIG